MKRYTLIQWLSTAGLLGIMIWGLIDRPHPADAATIRNPMITESESDLILTINHDPYSFPSPGSQSHNFHSLPLRHWTVEDLEISEERRRGFIDSIKTRMEDIVYISGKIRHKSNPHDTETAPTRDFIFFLVISPGFGEPLQPDLTTRAEMAIPHPGTDHTDVFIAELKAMGVFPSGVDRDLFFGGGYSFTLTANHEVAAPEVVEVPYDSLTPGTSIGIYWELKNQPGVIHAGGAVVDSTGKGKVEIIADPDSIKQVWRHETPINSVRIWPEFSFNQLPTDKYAAPLFKDATGQAMLAPVIDTDGLNAYGTFEIGQTFDVNDGVIADLPGVMFKDASMVTSEEDVYPTDYISRLPNFNGRVTVYAFQTMIRTPSPQPPNYDLLINIIIVALLILIIVFVASRRRGDR